MSTEEIGAYALLLCFQWNAGSVPGDDDSIRRIARVTQAFPLGSLKAKFEIGPDGLLRNARLEKERAKQVAYREKQAINGQIGGRPKGLANPSLSSGLSQTKAKKSFPSPSPSPSPKKDSPAAPVSSEHQAFVKGWSENFKAQFDSEYQFDGGRDGKAVQELLRMSIPRIDLLEIAKKAWARGRKVKSFNCEKASTIHGFRHYFNDIQVEVKHGHTHQQLNKRNIGVAGAGQDDYAAAAKRKVERQVAEAANRHPPQTPGNGT